MTKRWIVLVSRAGASIFTLGKEEELNFLTNIQFPKGRKKNKDLQDDQPSFGMAQQGGKNVYRMAKEETPHEHVADVFAKKLTTYLHKKWLNHSVDQITIIAEAKMLGKLKKKISNQFSEHINWVKKDLKKVPKDKWKISI